VGAWCRSPSVLLLISTKCRTGSLPLAYLGDATIGRNVNIGPARSPAIRRLPAKMLRYRGRRLHRSDCQLIAPVRVGQGAYVAAGSTITEDVPAGALGIARGRQENKQGWSSRRSPGLTMINCRNCINWVDEASPRSRPTTARRAHVHGVPHLRLRENNASLESCPQLRPEREPLHHLRDLRITIPKSRLARRVRQLHRHRPVLRRSMHRWRQPQVLHALRAAAHRGGPPDPRKPGRSTSSPPSECRPRSRPPPPGRSWPEEILPKKPKERLLTRPARAIALAFTVCSLAAERASTRSPNGDWRCYGNDPAEIRSRSGRDRSPQRRAARARLTYHTGETQTRNPEAFECTPLAVDGRLYLSTPGTSVIALDGGERARALKFRRALASRGAAQRTRRRRYWEGRREAKRSLFGTLDGRLIVLERRPASLPGLGARRHGRPPARRGPTWPTRSTPSLRRRRSSRTWSSPAPPFRKDRNRAERRPVRAFDVGPEGKVWQFDHTAARPTGHDTWKESLEQRTGVNCWSIMSVRHRTGLVFLRAAARFTTSTAAMQGKNLYGNLPGRVEARTGKLVWHFQMVQPRRLGLRPCPLSRSWLADPRRPRRPAVVQSRRWLVFGPGSKDGSRSFRSRSARSRRAPLREKRPGRPSPFPVRPPGFASVDHARELSHVSPSGEVLRGAVDRLKVGRCTCPAGRS